MQENNDILNPEELEKFITPELPEESEEQKINNLNESEKELTEEEKREQRIQFLKNSHIHFKSIKTKGNKTINQFGTSYKKERKRKNKLAKQSRKKNRK
jgi:hypothetical protein